MLNQIIRFSWQRKGCHFLFVSNQDVELIPKIVDNSLVMKGIHFFPHHDEDNENPYPEKFPVPELIHPSFADGLHDIVLNQKVKDVITSLNYFFTLEHFFDGKGFI